MGELRMITETGMFHSACKATVGGTSNWYGFKPRAHGRPMGPGFVDTSDRTAEEKYWATFSIDDVVLSRAIARVVPAYAHAYYTVTVQDCVSFTAAIARAAGMTLPDANITPYGFLEFLCLYNTPTARGRAASSAGRF